MWGRANYKERVLCVFCYVPCKCDISENPGPLCGKSRPQLLSGLPEFFLLWHSRKSFVCLATAFFHFETFSVFLPAGYHDLVSATCETRRLDSSAPRHWGSVLNTEL